MLQRPQLVAASKRDAVGADDPLPRLEAVAGELGLDVVAVSALTGEGLTRPRTFTRERRCTLVDYFRIV